MRDSIVRYCSAPPGTLIAWAKDGQPLCSVCVSENLELVLSATLGTDEDPATVRQWGIAAIEMSWEAETCSHCGKVIDSLQGEP